LGFPQPVPMIGFAFSEPWLAAHPDAAHGFLVAIDAADRVMADPAEWDRLKPLTAAADDATQSGLRRRFLAGLLSDATPGPDAAAKLYAVLAAVGGAGLTGGAAAITPGTFWTGGGK